jgi:hypothetical protein
MLTRRFFLKGLIVATTAPGIVRAASLMPIAVPKLALLNSDPWYTPPEFWVIGESQWSLARITLEPYYREVSRLQDELHSVLESQQRSILEYVMQCDPSVLEHGEIDPVNLALSHFSSSSSKRPIFNRNSS